MTIIMSGNINVYGLHSFTTPQDVFEVICSNWGSNTEEMAILDDYRFSQVIVERAIKAIVEFYIDRRSQEWLKDSFGINGLITGYLTNFNFFYYSALTRKFYCSIIDFDGCIYKKGFSDEEILIINELWNIHEFDKLVSKALNFVTDNITMFYEYDQEEVVEEFLKLYWKNEA